MAAFHIALKSWRYRIIFVAEETVSEEAEGAEVSFIVLFRPHVTARLYYSILGIVHLRHVVLGGTSECNHTQLQIE